MTTESPIGRALDELQTERAHLAARLAKVDAAITTLRELFHLPAATTAPSRKAKAPSPVADGPTSRVANGHEKLSSESIRAALKDGPLSPGALGAQLGVDRVTLRRRVVELEAAGVLTSSGTTMSRRIALAGRAAKEAP